mgnify:CR=1 FL=1
MKLKGRKQGLVPFHGRLLHPRCDFELVFMAGGALDQLELGIWSDQLALLPLAAAAADSNSLLHHGLYWGHLHKRR